MRFFVETKKYEKTKKKIENPRFSIFPQNSSCALSSIFVSAKIFFFFQKTDAHGVKLHQLFSIMDPALAGEVLVVWHWYRHRIAHQQGPRNPPQVWMKDFLRLRRRHGIFWTLLQELCDPRSIGHSAHFKEFLRIDVDLFNEILNAVTPYIIRHDTNWRECVTPGERLAITLRYIAAGGLYSSLQAQFRVSIPTISKIIPEVCAALIELYSEELIHIPETPAGWRRVAARFADRWNLHHAMGAIDGKHIRVKKPPNSFLDYRNYKRYYSILLFAMVDADFRFMYIDIGTPGKAGVAGIFRDSELKEACVTNTIGMPPDEPLPHDNTPMPYFIIGDDAFALNNFLMKPYPSATLTDPQRQFNYRISRARRVVECAFGVLANR